MARTPSGRPPGRPPSEGVTRSEHITIRITPTGKKAIDERRGQWSQAEYIRQALARAVTTNLRGPGA